MFHKFAILAIIFGQVAAIHWSVIDTRGISPPDKMKSFTCSINAFGAIADGHQNCTTNCASIVDNFRLDHQLTY
ncbi:hypothetical protein BLOT_000528 [Blomia tropicalis]|nr:hypothetical protein BLOT_000528 [Blomia tropicalis]